MVESFAGRGEGGEGGLAGGGLHYRGIVLHLDARDELGGEGMEVAAQVLHVDIRHIGGR